jgi:hypothetical protein
MTRVDHASRVSELTAGKDAPGFVVEQYGQAKQIRHNK